MWENMLKVFQRFTATMVLRSNSHLHTLHSKMIWLNNNIFVTILDRSMAAVYKAKLSNESQNLLWTKSADTHTQLTDVLCISRYFKYPNWTFYKTQPSIYKTLCSLDVLSIWLWTKSQPNLTKKQISVSWTDTQRIIQEIHAECIFRKLRKSSKVDIFTWHTGMDQPAQLKVWLHITTTLLELMILQRLTKQTNKKK